MLIRILPSIILGIALFIHSLRMIIFSFYMDNTTFGYLSQLLLILIIFTAFSNYGFVPLIYNRPSFRILRKVIVNRHFLGAYGMFLVGSFAVVIFSFPAAILVTVTLGMPFTATLILLMSSGLCLTILSLFRSASHPYLYPISYLIKAIAINFDTWRLFDVVINLESLILVGEPIAFILLLLIAYSKGLLRFKFSILSYIRKILCVNLKLATNSMLSIGAGFLLLNIERVMGAILYSHSNFGMLSKILIIKFLSSQVSFIFAVQFQRYFANLSIIQKQSFCIQLKQYELIIYSIFILIGLLSSFIVIYLFELIYNINIDYITGFCITLVALMIFFNPFSLILQTLHKFDKVLYASALSTILFVIFSMFYINNVMLLIQASLFSTLLFWVICRYQVLQLLLNNKDSQ